MRIYVAGKFEEKEIILNTYRILREMGHTVSYNWTTHKNLKPYTENQAAASEYAQNEFNGILNSDILIFLSNQNGHTLFMEFGAALASLKLTGKPLIYAVGQYNTDSQWFFNPLVQRVDSLEEAIKLISDTKQ